MNMHEMVMFLCYAYHTFYFFQCLIPCKGSRDFVHPVMCRGSCELACVMHHAETVADQCLHSVNELM
jgi:hypothetical protein